MFVVYYCNMSRLLIDLHNTHLTGQEEGLLCHPLVAGVILFRRNYATMSQLVELLQKIRQCRDGGGLPSTYPDFIIAVDHEGGRVQRFVEGFTKLPAMGAIERLPQAQQTLAAYCCAVVTATELRRVGIDLTFAPVLDRSGVSEVIGDRGFSGNIDTIKRLSAAFALGLASQGFPAVGKHFPGHGGVVPDTHHQLAIDERPFERLQHTELQPFIALHEVGLLHAVMSAHVIYPCVDHQPATFSKRWLTDILRQQMGFAGTVFSDDLSMAAARLNGLDNTPAANAEDLCNAVTQAWAAGVDYALVCNAPEQVRALLEGNALDATQRQALALAEGSPPRSLPAVKHLTQQANDQCHHHLLSAQLREQLHAQSMRADESSNCGPLLDAAYQQAISFLREVELLSS